MAYSIVSIFNIMIDPIIGLPYMIGNLIEFIVSMRRIQKFLLVDEMNPTIVDKSQGDEALDSEPVSFEIGGHSNFYWGVGKSKEEEDKKKAEEEKKEEEHKDILDKRKETKDKKKKKATEEEKDDQIVDKVQSPS